MKKVMKYVWITLSLIVLFISLSVYDESKNTSGIELFLGYMMLCLSFPIGLVSVFVAANIVGFIGMIWGWGFPLSFFLIILAWLVFFLLGLWQWLVFFPSLIDKFREDQVRIRKVIGVTIMSIWIGSCAFVTVFLSSILMGF